MKYYFLFVSAAVVIILSCNNSSQSDTIKDSTTIRPAPDNTKMADTGKSIGDTASYERMPQKNN